MLRYEYRFLISLLLTVVLELLGLIGMLGLFKIWKSGYLKRLKSSYCWLQIFGSTILCSTLTLPYLWFIFPLFFKRLKYIIVGELFVVIVEALIYRFLLKWKWYWSFGISLILNVISYFVGGWIWKVFL